MHSLRKILITATAAALLVVFSGASAQACSYSGAQQVFQPWGDANYYVPAPDGGFEAGGTGWLLSRGAAVVDGNEPFFLHGSADDSSLALPAGSSAVSPPICMQLDTPSFRLLARNTGDPSSRVRVEAVYPLLGIIRTKTISTVSTGSAWAPAQQMSTVLSLSTIVGTLIPAYIQIRITPLDTVGNWQVDDLYVDPFARH